MCRQPRRLGKRRKRDKGHIRFLDLTIRYEEIPDLSRSEIEDRLEHGEENDVIIAMLSAALYDEDAGWIEQICLRSLDSPIFNIRAIAMTSLGHVARIHGRLDLPTVNKKLCDVERDPDIAEDVRLLREEIEWWIIKRDEREGV